ncbi:hypothetical protein TNCV_1777021 [Trichonephila clavipes]|nr:hypothetical protein TNCV_1777021 [Trichonephila clavipes]
MNEKEEKRLTNSNSIKFIISFLNLIHTQTYPYPEEFGTVIDDDDDTNVDTEKELSIEQKLDLVIAKIFIKLSTIQKSDVSKNIRREIDLSEDEGFRGKY